MGWRDGKGIKDESKGSTDSKAKHDPEISAGKSGIPEVKQSYIERLKHVKIGTLQGLNPMVLTSSIPAYVYFRSKGLSQKEAFHKATEMTMKLMMTTAKAIMPELSPTLNQIEDKKSRMSTMELKDAANFVSSVAKDPEMKTAMANAGVVVALTAASGQDIDEATMTRIGKDLAATGGKVSEKKAIKEGHLSEQDVADIKRTTKEISAMQ
jgi:dihydroorotase-like cyclic amidohydrolase